MKIKNRSQILDELAEMLLKFANDCNEYQTDIYAYVTENAEAEITVELDTFTNVGGNSWRNDNHYTIYSDRQHEYREMFYAFSDKNELAKAACNYDQNAANELLEKIAEENEIEVEELDYFEVREYIIDNSEYYDNVRNVFEDCNREMYPDFLEQAEDIISQFEARYQEIQDEIKAAEAYN